MLVAVVRVPFPARVPAAGDSCQVGGHAAEVSGFLGRNCQDVHVNKAFKKIDG